MMGQTSQKRLRQETQLTALLRHSPIFEGIAAHADDIQLPDWHVCAGAVAQTIWNDAHGLALCHGIDDVDLIYFDEQDLSEAAEAAAQGRLSRLFEPLGVRFDVKNEARVHLWYESRFGKAIAPYRSIADAVSSFPTTATAIAVRYEDGWRPNCAPFGLDDLLNLVVRPNRRMVTPDVYEAKIARWRRHWPRLTYLPWEESAEGG